MEAVKVGLVGGVPYTKYNQPQNLPDRGHDHPSPHKITLPIIDQ